MRKRCFSLLFSFLLLSMSGCGSNMNTNDTVGTSSLGLNRYGVPYVTDPGIASELKKDPLSQPVQPAPSNPKVQEKVTPAVATLAPFCKKPLEFEIQRYNDKGEASRFGTRKITIRIYFAGREKPEEFNVQPNSGSDSTSAIPFSVNSPLYTLVGTLTDDQPLTTNGTFVLTDRQSKQSAKILYHVYKASLDVREDKENIPVSGSKLDQQVATIRDNTFGWVHNWAVADNETVCRAVYLLDIVKVGAGAGESVVHAPVFAFKGEALQTGDHQHPATTVAGTGHAVLVGNAETSSRKMFTVDFKDPATKKQTQVMLDVASEEKQTQDVSIDPSTSPIPPAQDDAGSNTSVAVEPAPVVTPPSNAPKTSLRPQPNPNVNANTNPNVNPNTNPPVTGNAYLRIDTSLPRTARMVHDFNLNRAVPGVLNEITQYENARLRYGKKPPKDQISNFYRYANPFRHMIQAIGHAFDVSPAFVYLTVLESPYFTGGNYYSHSANGIALGIFQFQTKTASGVGMRVGGGEADERYYFAPSACGAARYTSELVDQFKSGDTTLAVLGYNRGPGGAAAAIACSLGGNIDNRVACGKTINNGMNSKQYLQYVRWANNFSYTYAEIERVAAIPQTMRDYVNRKLAIFFISANMAHYNFSIPDDARRQYPNNNSVMPPNPINDPLCRATISGL